MLYKFCCAIALTLLLVRPALADQDTITILADPWCPYNCRADSDNPGIGIEIAQRVFDSYGIKVQYIEKDWQASLDAVRAGEYDAVVGAFQSDAPDFIYPRQPFAYSRNCFFTLASKAWDYRGTKSLNTVRMGAIEGYSYGSNIDRYISEHKDPNAVSMKTGLDGLDQLFAELDEGEIDALVEDSWVVFHRLLGHGGKGKYRVAGCQPPGKLFIAFSPAKPKRSRRFATLLDQGIGELKRSGEIRTIYDHYGVVAGEYGN